MFCFFSSFLTFADQQRGALGLPFLPVSAPSQTFFALWWLAACGHFDSGLWHFALIFCTRADVTHKLKNPIDILWDYFACHNSGTNATCVGVIKYRLKFWTGFLVVACSHPIKLYPGLETHPPDLFWFIPCFGWTSTTLRHDDVYTWLLLALFLSRRARMYALRREKEFGAWKKHFWIVYIHRRQIIHSHHLSLFLYEHERIWEQIWRELLKPKRT